MPGSSPESRRQLLFGGAWTTSGQRRRATKSGGRGCVWSLNSESRCLTFLRKRRESHPGKLIGVRQDATRVRVWLVPVGSASPTPVRGSMGEWLDAWGRDGQAKMSLRRPRAADRPAIAPMLETPVESNVPRSVLGWQHHPRKRAPSGVRGTARRSIPSVSAQAL